MRISSSTNTSYGNQLKEAGGVAIYVPGFPAHDGVMGHSELRRFPSMSESTTIRLFRLIRTLRPRPGAGRRGMVIPTIPSCPPIAGP